MRTKSLLGVVVLTGAFLFLAIALARESSLSAATIRCMRYSGAQREQCLKQGSPATRGRSQSLPALPAPMRSYTVENSDLVVPGVTGDDHLRGNPTADVTIIEYVDFECPFCKRHVSVMSQTLSTYGDSVNLVVRHFPLPFHKNAFAESEAAECAARVAGNSAFWKYHDELFARTTSGGTGFAIDKLVPLARELGIPSDAFESCIKNAESSQTVADQFAAGKSAGVSATPTTFIVQRSTGKAQKILGSVPFSRYQSVIDGMLGK
jgi:protein-disulfide isomerase